MPDAISQTDTPTRDGEPRRYGPVPAVGEHSAKVRAEFAAKAAKV